MTSTAEDSTAGAEIFFGGTFDPLHLGHLMIASEACEALGCGSVLFSPAAQNPSKERGPVASGSDRLEMVRRATSGDDRFRVTSWEVEQAGPSRTYDSVVALIAAGLLVTRPWILIGEELVADLPRWYRVSDLLKVVRVAVVRRGGNQDYRGALGAGAGEQRDSIGLSPEYIENPRYRVSGTELRERLQNRRTVKYLIPDSVYAYITEHSLYL